LEKLDLKPKQFQEGEKQHNTVEGERSISKGMARATGLVKKPKIYIKKKKKKNNNNNKKGEGEGVKRRWV
jgi:hypothetical protein